MIRTAARLSPDSSTTGTGDALDELEQDHRRVETLFAQASLTAGTERQVAVDLIVHELSVHASVEEQVVYPAIAEVVGGGKALADGAREDHQEIKEILARLDKADATAEDPTLVDELRKLQLVVQQHVSVEEGELFPAYRAKAAPDALVELTEAATAARQAAPTRPHPHAPSSGPGAVVADAVAGVVDKVRDAAVGRDA